MKRWARAVFPGLAVAFLFVTPVSAQRRMIWPMTTYEGAGVRSASAPSHGDAPQQYVGRCMAPRWGFGLGAATGLALALTLPNTDMADIVYFVPMSALVGGAIGLLMCDL